MIIVLSIVAFAVALFVLEPVPLDVTAMLVLVLLVLLGPWTEISPEEAVSGFSNSATITVLAMLIISEGVRRTGVIQALARRLSRMVGTSEKRHLAATLGMAGPISGFMNNTPVVALLMPVVSEMAHKGRISPSKLLIPLSYVSMLGGTLTLIGTSTNILASDLSARILGHSIGMFEFTALGVVVMIAGGIYLFFAAPILLPARVEPRGSYLESFKVASYLREIKIWADAPMLGMSVQAWLQASEIDIEVLALTRGHSVFEHPDRDQIMQEGDVLLVHATADCLEKLGDLDGVEVIETPKFTPDQIMISGDFNSLVEVVVLAGSALEERTIADVNFPEQFDAYVLALRSRSRVLRENFDDEILHSGDNLLVQTTREGHERMLASPDVVVISTQERPDYRPEKIPVVVVILVAVVALAAFDFFPIMVTSLAGVVAMLLCGVIRPAEMYQGVDWRVIFMLAGIIPLGLALEQTGAAAYLGEALAATGDYLPAIAVLWLFYIATGLITEFISNNAAVLLMIPVAAATATAIDANEFAFVLAVMFAASTAFLGPVGYQTNLFVYGPGGYRVRDFIRIGAPLQVLLSVVTVGGIDMIWGV
jgi:di/tricarboxylate transporter